MLPHSIPQLRTVLLTKEHNSLASSCSQIVRLFDAMNEEVMQVFVFVIKMNKLLCRVVREVHCKSPW